MTIQWLGHSCFLITSSDGRTLLTDPFDETVGYALPKVPANVVTCSHDHFDHHAIQPLPNGYTVIDTPGTHHNHGFVVEGIPSFHDEKQGSLRGSNIIYKFQVDGLKVAHMGDLGHLPTKAMEEQLQGIDIMLLPVGGVYTVDGDQAAQIVEMVKPRLVIPMHYRTDELRFELNGPEAFLRHFDHRELNSDRVEINAENIGDYAPVLVLSYK
ncbi:MAG: MBL fold metallo-hydrolase [Candidatus Excrementavichristensenella sp.]|jgi:L-ascorbate metabolism protein UlaG (beta-lactamase superfamily)|nr:MBL fold metallo-hydrolase [Bacillota bacterium]NLL54953.1 MBL fold metallo-hydrolase [Clostridiales bacterium]